LDQIPPIDVLWYEAPNSGNNYFFSMSGCHRWEYVEINYLNNSIIFFPRAHQRLNLPTIRAKLIRTTLNDLKIYFGSSLPNLP
jgi:sulfiredoxin